MSIKKSSLLTFKIIIMPNYCVNRNAQPTGEHEVHKLDGSCTRLPEKSNQLDLGWHPDCHSAVRKAREFYNNVDGCYYCCASYHTK